MSSTSHSQQLAQHVRVLDAHHHRSTTELLATVLRGSSSSSRACTTHDQMHCA